MRKGIGGDLLSGKGLGLSGLPHPRLQTHQSRGHMHNHTAQPWLNPSFDTYIDYLVYAAGLC